MTPAQWWALALISLLGVVAVLMACVVVAWCDASARRPAEPGDTSRGTSPG